MDKISGEVIKFIENAMENWRSKLTAEGKSLTEMKIQRVIFQGNALYPFLFVIAMMPLNHIKMYTNFINCKKKSTTACTRTTSNC